MTNRLILSIFFVGILLLNACTDDTEPNPTPETKPNILLIIADDMGVDATPGYNIGSMKPIMPHLQALMNEGWNMNLQDAIAYKTQISVPYSKTLDMSQMVTRLAMLRQRKK